MLCIIWNDKQKKQQDEKLCEDSAERITIVDKHNPSKNTLHKLSESYFEIHECGVESSKK